MALLLSVLDALLLDVLLKCPRPWASEASSLNYDLKDVGPTGCIQTWFMTSICHT